MTRYARTRGLTLLEVLVAVSIMAILGLALVQLLSSGMYTWRTGEMRRGAYERVQVIFDRVSRDLSTLYPRAPEMPDASSFKIDSLWSPNYDGTGASGISFSSQNILRQEKDEIRWFQPADSGSEAWVEYGFDLPQEPHAAVVQPRITLVRSPECEPTCKVIVETAVTSGFEEVMSFTSGLHDQVITPDIDISSMVSTLSVKLRLRIVPEPGKQSDVRLFEAAADDPNAPVLRFAASPRYCLVGVGLVSDYEDSDGQFLSFVRSAEGLKQVVYFVEGETLYRIQGDFGSPVRAEGAFDLAKAAAIAKGVVYFGCEFPDRSGKMKAYWREADSVPPYVKVVVSLIPLSGAKTSDALSGDVSASDTTIPVLSTKPFVLGNPDRQFVKIGGEWISYEGLSDNRLIGCVRGRRGTLPAAHEKGAPVIGAETFWLNIAVPAWGYRSR